MPDAGLNELWCRCIAEELRRGGARLAVLCPGSRNSPLLFALAGVFGADAVSHIDERSAAFIALGAIRATGRPALVCVTSGSALANCSPALAEAQGAGLPLIVVAADRPWEARDCGAPQTMPQAHTFARLVEREVVLGEPVADERSLRALRARLSRLAQGGGPAIVHAPLREPLLAAPGAVWVPPTPLPECARNGRGYDQPYTRLGGGLPWLRPGLRGVIVAGPAPVDAGAARRIAAESGFPLLADAPSGLRLPGMPGLVCHHDALLAGPLGDEAPDVVIQLGDAPLSRRCYEWLDRAACPWVVVEDDGRDRDWLARAWSACRELPALPRGDAAWAERWQAAEAAARSALPRLMAEEPWGEVAAAHAACAHAGFPQLLLANSMAVRHGNLYCLARERRIHANRGVNGIDGSLGSALGLALAGTGPTLLLCGDLAFLHDLPALCALREARRSLAIVVIDNQGGGIFDHLAVAAQPGYETWVRTPRQADLAGLALASGLEARRIADRCALEDALDEAARAPGARVLHVAVAPAGAVDRHRLLVAGLAGARPHP